MVCLYYFTQQGHLWVVQSLHWATYSTHREIERIKEKISWLYGGNKGDGVPLEHVDGDSPGSDLHSCPLFRLGCQACKSIGSNQHIEWQESAAAQLLKAMSGNRNRCVIGWSSAPNYFGLHTVGQHSELLFFKTQKKKKVNQEPVWQFSTCNVMLEYLQTISQFRTWTLK